MDMDAPQAHIDFAALGKRLSRLREVRGWTLDELAARTGLSVSHLSRMESGDRQPSLATLSVLAQAYGVKIGTLFDDDEDPCIILRGADAAPLSGNHLTYAPLSRRSPQTRLQALRITVRPDDPTVYSHTGEQWLYVLSGRLHLRVGAEEHWLEPGDAAHFLATIPHQFSAPVERITEILVVATAGEQPLLSGYR